MQSLLIRGVLNGPSFISRRLRIYGLPDDVPGRGSNHVDGQTMTVIQWIYADQVDAYLSQGWIVTKMMAHHGARKAGRNFMAVIEL